MEVSSLGNFTAAQKQNTEKNEGSKDSRLSIANSQATNTDEVQASPIPPVKETTELSGQEGNKTNSKSGSGAEIDLLA
jgi:hypothetical protein